MGFSLNPGHVQGLLFVRRAESEGFSGKWKYEIVLDMSDVYHHHGGPEGGVLAAWVDGKQDGVQNGATGFWLVVPSPYHRHAYPVMVAI